MQAGLATPHTWEELELYMRLRSTAAYSGSGGRAAGGSGSLQTSYTPDNVNTNPGFWLSIAAQQGTGGGGGALDTKTTYRLQVPDFSIDTSVATTTFDADASMKLLFVNHEVYGQNGLVWKVKCDEWRWYINGSLQSTYSGFDVNLSYFTPASVPMFGIPAMLRAGGITQPVPVQGPVLSPNLVTGSCEGTGRVTGGWRFKEDGTYYSLPVTVGFLDPPALTCEASPSTGTAEATNTYNADLTGSRKWTVTTYTRRVSSRGAELVMLPDLERGVVRMNSAYAAMIIRGGMPYGRRRAARGCEFIALDDEETTTTAETTDEPFQSYSAFLATVTNDPHIIEEPFTRTLYAPGQLTGSESYMTTAGVTNSSVTSTVGIEVQTRAGTGGNPQMLPYLSHDYNSYARYINYLATPHASYGYWWPRDVDDDHPATGVEWKVYGAVVNPGEYWVPIRTQHLTHPTLPTADNRRTRTSIVGSPLYEGAYSTVLGTYLLGYGNTSYWGNHRHKTQALEEYSAPYTLTAASSGEWSFTDCTASFTSTRIELDPDSGHTTIKARYDCGTWSARPYMKPHHAGSISVDWDDANITAVRTYQVGVTGTRILLGTAKATYAKQTARETNFAGSWQQDFGAAVITDAGTDTDAAGISAATMADRERVHHFQLVSGYGAAAFEIEIDVVSDAALARLKYPTFTTSPETARVYQEQGHHADLIFPNGPGLRFGHWQWLQTDPVTLLRTQPEIVDIGTAPLGWKTSILDALCWRRVVVEGKERSDGLAAEIDALYNYIELIGVDTAPSNDNQRYREADGLSVAFLSEGGTGGRLHLVNSCGEFFPLATLPHRKRDTSDWSLTGTHAQISYAYDQEDRYYVSADVAMDLVNPADMSVWTSAATLPPAGWFVRRHARIVDGTEGDAFDIRWNGMKYAQGSPWHGYFGMLGRAGPSGSHCDYDVSRWQRHARVYLVAGEIMVGVASNTLPITFADMPTGISADYCRVCWDRTQIQPRLWITYGDAGTVYTRYSTSDGATFSMPTTVASGTQSDSCVSNSGERFVYYRTSAGDVKAKVYDPLDNLARTITTNVTGVDNTSIAAGSSTSEDGSRFRVHLTYSVSGAITTASSSDGVTFS